MAVRKIKKNHLVITGGIARPGQKPAEHEGPLEADYYILLKHDPEVESFEHQPVEIKVPDARPYTPDVLVRFLQPETGRRRRPELTEVKPKHILEKEAEHLAARFAAARAHCKKLGWLFVIKTGEDMNQVRLKNIRLLRGFMKHPQHAEHHTLILQMLESHGAPMSVDELVDACSPHADALTLMSPIWRGVICRDFSMDFDQPISMASLITLGNISR